jgi:hypothetical protein
MKNSSSDWPTLREWLRQSVANRDEARFAFVAPKITPNQFVQFSLNYPALANEAHGMLWCLSASWGHEVAWVYEHSLPEEEREMEPERLAALEDLTPDLPLSQHPKWSPLDHLDRLGVADAASQLWAEVTRKGAADV